MQPPTIEAAFDTPRAFACAAFLAVEPKEPGIAGGAATVHIWAQDGYYTLHLDAHAARAISAALTHAAAPVAALPTPLKLR